MLKNTVQGQIKFYREEQGITQRQLAERLGYKGADQIARIERGKKEITLKMLAEIAEALKVREEDLIVNQYSLVIRGSEYKFETLMLFAYRYAIGRHFTQTMWNIEPIILQNLNMIHDEFIRQMIQGILDEKRCERYGKNTEGKEKADFFYRLRKHVEDYERYLRDEKGDDAKEMYGLLVKVLELCNTVKIEDKCSAYDRFGFGTEYLDNMLEQLQQEYERRGHQRIVDEM